MTDFVAAHWLDILTTLLGLVYIWLEYKAHIGLWIVGIIMPALDVYLYYSHGLYGDAGMAVYYTLAAIYGYAAWRMKGKGAAGDGQAPAEKPITHFPRRLVLPVTAVFAVLWVLTWWVLSHYTNSNVPWTDAFTNALSFIGLWALARKYIEQWGFWIVVDTVCTVLYVQKGIPFKAGLYGLYVIIAIFGYFKWQRLMRASRSWS